jgi:hypothetical protein
LIVESSGPLVAVVVSPVALLPLIVIMPPVKVVVRSVALLPLAAVVPRRREISPRRILKKFTARQQTTLQSIRLLLTWLQPEMSGTLMVAKG